MILGFIGLGRIGLRMAEVAALRGHDAMGYDLSPVQMQPARLGPVAPVSMSVMIQQAQIVFVCVPVHCVKEAVNDIARHSAEPIIAIVTTPLSPGFFKTMLEPLVKDSPVRLVYSPHLMPYHEWDVSAFTNPDFYLLNSSDGEVRRTLLLFFQTISKAPLRIMSEVESVEKVWDAYVSLWAARKAMIRKVAEVIVGVADIDKGSTNMAFNRAKRLWGACEDVIP